MRINEEFFDGHNIETGQIEDDDIQKELCRFSIDYCFSKFDGSDKTKPMVPEDIVRQFKTVVNFVRKSPVFSNAVIDNLDMEIEHGHGNTFDNEYFGMSYNEFRKRLPQTVFGIPIKIKDIYGSNSGLHISSTIEFTASLNPDSPADIYRLFKILLIPNNKATKTYFRIYPQFVPNETQAKLVSWITGREFGDMTIKRGEFHEGSFFQLYFSDAWVTAGNFIEFYHMFMDREQFDRFHDYIKRTGKDNGFAIDHIKTRIGFDDLKKTIESEQ